MIPDTKWMDFLSQPGKVTGALFAFFACSLVLDWAALVELSAFGSLAKPVFILGGALTGFLFLGSIIAFGIEQFAASQKRTQVERRRMGREEKHKAKKAQFEAMVLARLDHLSKEEIRVVADALRTGSQSFFAYAQSPAVAAMAGKAMLNTPGGTYHQDHYPFNFYDFVWKALLERREEFISKHEEFGRIAAEEERRSRGRRN
jgi:hypothetical protein